MSERVGDGLDYEAIRAAARELLPVFTMPGQGMQSHWGAGIIETLQPTEDGHQASIVYPVVSRWGRCGNSLRRPVSIEEIRATGIVLLVYAEVHDPNRRALNDEAK